MIPGLIFFLLCFSVIAIALILPWLRDRQPKAKKVDEGPTRSSPPRAANAVVGVDVFGGIQVSFVFAGGSHTYTLDKKAALFVASAIRTVSAALPEDSPTTLSAFEISPDKFDA